MRERLRRNSNKQSRGVRTLLTALVVLGVLWSLPVVASWGVSVVMAPVHAVDQWLRESSSLVPTFIRSRVALQEEIETLRNDLAVARSMSVTERRLVEENNRLRNLLGIATEERIAAGIVARPDELPYDLLQIDKGSDDGVEVGAPVFMGKDIVIGLVVHVASDYAFVQMVTSNGFQSSAFISGPNVVVTMEGLGGGVARVLVPQGIHLAIDNLVYLPSVEPGVFGRISYIENLPTQPEQYGYVTPDIPISSLYQVAVGQRSQVTQSVAEIEERIQHDIQTQLLIEGLPEGLVATSSEDGGEPVLDASTTTTSMDL